MNIFSISDLHLSLFREKTMDIFGEHWKDHHEKVKRDWEKRVSAEDIILIPGDISWAMSLSEALPDLKFIEALPGKKIFVKGNHDYWWGSLQKIEDLSLKDCYFLQNNSFSFNGISFCGTRGWLIPEDGEMNEDDHKIYKRECLRLINSLEKAENDKQMVLMHYPPVSKEGIDSQFVEIMKDYNVKVCVYGHIHSGAELRNFINGDRGGIQFYLVACDYLDFKLKKIL